VDERIWKNILTKPSKTSRRLRPPPAGRNQAGPGVCPGFSSGLRYGDRGRAWKSRGVHDLFAVWPMCRRAYLFLIFNPFLRRACPIPVPRKYLFFYMALKLNHFIF
jgi:hypothetical protein